MKNLQRSAVMLLAVLVVVVGGFGAARMILQKSSTLVTGSVSVDPSSLYSPTHAPVISGSASRVDSLVVILGTENEGFWTSDPIPVTDGRWTVTVSDLPKEIPAGTYVLVVRDSKTPTGEDLAKESIKIGRYRQ